MNEKDAIDDDETDKTNSDGDLGWMVRFNDGIYGEYFAYVAKRYATQYEAIVRR